MSDSDDDLITDALAFGATVGGEFDRWITWAVATIRDRNAEIERLRAERTYEARAATVEHCDDPWTCCIHTPEMRDEVPR